MVSKTMSDPDIYWFWFDEHWWPLREDGQYLTKNDVSYMKRKYPYRILPTHKGPKSPPTTEEFLGKKDIRNDDNS